MSEQTRSTWQLVPRLALADMRHEIVLSFCMIVALVAIITPLMLLLGLRYGSIETLRQRLVQNPTYREIWPSETMNLSDSWFEEMAARPEIEFVLPTILRGASIIGVRRSGESRVINFDLVPTSAGDPLLLENETPVPEAGEIVLSRVAAEQLELLSGDDLISDEVELEVSRRRDGRQERERLSAKVVGVLPFEGDSLERVYAPFDLVAGVERYREGLAVPVYGWEGGTPTPYASFDGVVVASPEPLSAPEQTGLRIGTGFAAVDELGNERLNHLTGLSPSPDMTFYDVKTLTRAATASNLIQLRNKLRGRGAIMLPYVEPIEASIGGDRLHLIGLSLDDAEAHKLGTTATPWGGFDTEVRGRELNKALMSDARAAETLAAEVVFPDGSVQFPLQVVGSASKAVVPIELMGILRTGRDRAIAWDSGDQGFVLAQSGYFGFRLYTNTIDEVPPLYRQFLQKGLGVEAHVQDIERIQVLDAGLVRLFILIASVGVIGGSGAMVASLYASVDRKKRELGVMRLMGLSRRDVSLFPVYQGLTLSGFAVISAIVVFLIFSAVINTSFAGEFREGEKLCYLPVIYYVVILSFTLLAALLSSLVAARRATTIEPAEAIREE